MSLRAITGAAFASAPSFSYRRSILGLVSARVAHARRRPMSSSSSKYPVRNLPPIQSPPPEPSSIYPPRLPSPPRSAAGILPGYSLTTHLVPASHPRITPKIPFSKHAEPVPGETRQERSERCARVTEEILETRRLWIEGKLRVQAGHDSGMWNCVNRFVRDGVGKDGPRGLTMLFVHANGFHKETWEPMLRHLIRHTSSSSRYVVDEIWTRDASQSGDSALVNRESLSGMYDWVDNARDILNFLLYYLPSKPSTSEMPTHLVPINPQESASRSTRGFSERTLVTVGHSFGGCTSVLAAIWQPSLFSSLFLVDPIIASPDNYGPIAISAITAGAVKRRDGWPSRAEALKQMKDIPFFAAWDSTVLELYVQHALYEDTAAGVVKLKMPPMQEALAFTEYRVPCETYELLTSLDERVELYWVIPDTLQEKARLLAGRRPARSECVLMDANHLIPQEAPEDLAKVLDAFLATKYGIKHYRAKI